MLQGILLTQQPRMTVMTSETKHYVSSIACNAVRKAMNEVEIATAIDRVLRRRYTIRFARTEPADCPVHDGSIVTCDMSPECPGHLQIG